MSVIREIYPYLRPYRRRVALAVLGTLAFNLLALLPPLVYRRLVDDVVKAGQWHLLVPVLLVYGLLPLLINVVNFGNVLNIVFVGTRLVSDVRNAMYQLILRLSMRYHGTTSAGAVITRLMGDVNTVQQLVSGQTIQLVGDIVVFLFSISVAFSINTKLALILLVVVALYVSAYRLFGRRIRAATEASRSLSENLTTRLQETISGVRQVRIYNREADERRLFLDRSAEVMDHAVRSGINSVGLGATCGVVAGYGSTVIYGLAAAYVLTTPMTLGDLLALNSYVWMVLHPALRLTSFAGEFAQIGVSIERISEVLREVPEIRSAPDAPPIHAPSGRVEFCGVDFAYKPDEPLFRDLCLSVAPGKTVALVGHTGCGKSTLTSLLMRFWDPQGGCVRIDGTDIRSVRLNSLRELFGVVLQNPIVFDGSIAENIVYGRPEATRAEIEAAAEAAEITEFASRLPQGLDTVLGTYGVKLSLGEKQRVSIARAIVKNPRILVMDEATSSLDSECEALIQRAISRALKGRTSFVVAHRLSTIVAADLIVVLDAGRIMETGRHDELMAVENGRYRKLYDEMRGAAEPGGGAT